MSDLLVRIGIHPGPRWGAALKEIGASALISANALRKRGKFRQLRDGAFGGHTDVALDSAGFVAMVRYGSYQWTVAEYVDLAASFPWAWWASMDFCCEPDVARDQQEIASRVAATARLYRECCDTAAAHGASQPMPVLQGWRAKDYLACAEQLGDLPDLVGLGSMCRRHLAGDDGLFAVLRQLDAGLPAHVKLHLFGVKGTAIGALVGHPRIASVDSMAWDYAFRRETMPPRTVSRRVDFMCSWWRRQTEARSLFGAAA